MKIELDLKPFAFEGISNERPLIIAGPCSAESEEQVLDTAQQLKNKGINLFRAGIWKPRTRPNAFEGYGSDALPWMRTVKQETGMLISTEVANAKHVYEALKYGFDMLWIGARTSANPFAVQEIADALRGVDIPVMVKNPVNPDVELWIGALERLYQAGITKLAAGHRGFSTYGKSVYRNEPHWQIPIELKRRIPNLPLIVDPSHICGSRERLLEISQRAMDLNFDGIIIESHCNPDVALSDAKQQLTPDALGEMLSKLVLRSPELRDGSIDALAELRAEIDKIDDTIVDIMGRRMEVADKIGQYKKEQKITILQTKRWDEILNKRVAQGELKGLSAEFIEKVFMAIHQESINHQTKIMNE
jgi:chorismate mutase